MDPITQKMIAIMQTILFLLTQILAGTTASLPPTPTVSTSPYLPKTSFTQQAAKSKNLGAFNPSAGGTYRLASSIGTTNTSISLSSFKEPISNVSYTMSYLNSSIEYGTLEPGNSTKKELISFTGITQNADGSATLTGVTRGLSLSYPYTASTTFQLTHSGQSIFILSDAPQLFSQYANKSGPEIISGSWVFTTAPTSTDECSGSTEYCTKAYIDGLSIQGAATSTETNMGIVRLATNTELAAGTASSSSGQPIVPANRSFNSTYVGTANNIVPVTKTNNGLQNTIDPNYIATSSPYTFASTTIHQANLGNLTATGTINIAGSGQAASSTRLTSNGAGGLSFLPESWGLLTRATNSGAVATATANFAPRSRLRIIFSGNGLASASNGNSLAFNASSTNYSYVRMLDGVVASQARNTQISNEWGANSTTSPFSIVFEINNGTSSVKQASYTGSYASPTGMPMFTSGVVVWGGLDAQINQVSFNADRWGDAQTNTFLAGSVIEVYGSDTRN